MGYSSFKKQLSENNQPISLLRRLFFINNGSLDIEILGISRDWCLDLLTFLIYTTQQVYIQVQVRTYKLNTRYTNNINNKYDRDL